MSVKAVDQLAEVEDAVGGIVIEMFRHIVQFSMEGAL